MCSDMSPRPDSRSRSRSSPDHVSAALRTAMLALVCAERIQQCHLAAARQQRLVLVLAVDLHQHRGEVGQLSDRRGATIDPGARTTIRAQGAAQLALAAFVEFRPAQPVQRRGRVVQFEHRHEFGALGAVADHAAVRALAGQEGQRVHQQGLARARLTGDDGQPRAEIQFRGGDDGEILDR